MSFLCELFPVGDTGSFKEMLNVLLNNFISVELKKMVKYCCLRSEPNKPQEGFAKVSIDKKQPRDYLKKGNRSKLVIPNNLDPKGNGK